MLTYFLPLSLLWMFYRQDEILCFVLMFIDVHKVFLYKWYTCTYIIINVKHYAYYCIYWLIATQLDIPTENVDFGLRKQCCPNNKVVKSQLYFRILILLVMEVIYLLTLITFIRIFFSSLLKLNTIQKSFSAIFLFISFYSQSPYINSFIWSWFIIFGIPVFTCFDVSEIAIVRYC